MVKLTRGNRPSFYSRFVNLHWFIHACYKCFQWSWHPFFLFVLNKANLSCFTLHQSANDSYFYHHLKAQKYSYNTPIINSVVLKVPKCILSCQPQELILRSKRNSISVPKKKFCSILLIGLHNSIVTQAIIKTKIEIDEFYPQCQFNVDYFGTCLYDHTV